MTAAQGELSMHPSRNAPVEARGAILVVDDVEANLTAMDALLCDLGEIVLARSGNEALLQLLKREFAVMLLDVQMPAMDGYEVARYARENPDTRGVPIVFLTAGATPLGGTDDKGHLKEWTLAIQGGKPAKSNFADYAGGLTETILLGNLAVYAAPKAGEPGKKIEWNAKEMKPTNAPELAHIVKRDYRNGYTL